MKAVIFTWPQYSHVKATIPIVRALLKKNVDVYLFSDAIYSELFTTLEINFIPYNIDQVRNNYLKEELFKTHKILTPHIKDLHTFLDFKEKECENMVLRHILYSNSLIDVIKTINPDIIFRDACSFFGKILGNKLNVKVIGYTTNLIISKSFIQTNPIKFLSLMENADLSYLKNYETFNIYDQIDYIHQEICDKYNVPKLPVYPTVNPSEKVNLTFGAEKLQPKLDTFQNLKNYIIQPEFVDPQNTDISKEALIYVSTGSFHVGPNILYNSIINLFKNTNFKVIISIPKEKRKISSKKLPKNIIIKEFVNQKEILKKAALFITHGGYNSICESIFYKTPMIVIPLASDQFMNAFLIESLNLGRTIASDSITTEKLGHLIVDISNDEEIDNQLSIIKNSLLNSQRIDNLIESLSK